MTATKNSFSPEQFFNADAFKPFLNASAFNPQDTMESQRRNAEALTAASKEAAEAAKALVQCQTNFCRGQMEDMTTFWRNWMSSGANIQDKLEIQNQTARDSFAKAMACNKEVTAIMHKTQEKVMHAFTESAKETIKASAKQATKASKFAESAKETINKAAKQTKKASK
jgi:phasin family protein